MSSAEASSSGEDGNNLLVAEEVSESPPSGGNSMSVVEETSEIPPSGEDGNALLIAEEASTSPPSGEEENSLLAENLLGSEETLPSGEDGNTSLVAEEEWDSQESLGCPKAQQTSQDQPGETSPKDVSFHPRSGEEPVAFSGEDAVAEMALDSAMRPSLSKAPTAVASRDLPPGETSPKEESLEPRSVLRVSLAVFGMLPVVLGK